MYFLEYLCGFLLFSSRFLRSQAKLPSSITPCQRRDPALESCILHQVEALRPQLRTGNLGDGYRTPPLEPLLLDNIELGQGPQFQATFSDMTVRGGSNFIINHLSANVEDFMFDLRLTLPRINFTGNYVMRMNILLLKVLGEGKMHGYCENAKASVRMRGQRYWRTEGQDRKEHVRLVEMPLNIKIRTFRMKLENLFNGDEVLGEVTNTLINENQDLYLQEIVPGMERALSQKFLLIANRILANTSYDELFP